VDRAQVLQHAAGDQLAWAAAPGTGNGPDYNPFDPSGTFYGRLISWSLRPSQPPG
jgi:hypothetical protein